MSKLIHVPLSAVRLDQVTQVRVEINNAMVTDYAQTMSQGIKLPPIDVFSNGVYAHGETYLIGDGWHRFLACQQNGDVTLEARLHDGGRIEAIKFALKANATHGIRRTNADKRRAVEIALREFSEMSDRAIAEMCGVHHDMVRTARPKDDVADSATSPVMRTDTLGRKQPATKPKKAFVPLVELLNPNSSPLERMGAALTAASGLPITFAPIEIADSEPKSVTRRHNAEVKFQGPTNGLLYARNAIAQLEKIEKRDQEKAAAFEMVRKYIERNGG